jgi:hypothetical protein
MKEIGFEEIHFTDIMKEEDTRFRWGYDDEIFYERLFEYLKKKYKNQTKLLVYIEVSAHHYPFNAKQGYSLPYNNPKDFAEKYANSVYVQDYALETFYNLYKKNWKSNSHLFILGDHSWPIGRNGGNTFNERGYYEDNFLTSMAFVPKEGSEYVKGQEVNRRFSETDFIKTIFSILNNKEYQNSFEAVLRGSEPEKYEDCHVLIQPYNTPAVAVVKYPNKYVYLIGEDKVLILNLEDDPDERRPTTVMEGVDKKEFYKDYLCERFKKN